MSYLRLAPSPLALFSLLMLCDGSPLGAAVCPGDCDGDGSVTVNEVVASVNIALGNGAVDSCPAVDANGDGDVTINEIVLAVSNALSGCPVAATPTPPPADTATASPTFSPTEVPTSSPTATSTALPTPTATPDAAPIPTTADELLAWLQAGNYLGWTAESAPHPSGGPHGGTVRTYVNDIVLESLRAGNASHPAGSAVVKELYFNGSSVQLWAVMVKVQANSDGGRGWYWWEGASYAGLGVPVCTNCHGGNYNGYVSKDYVLSNFPLQ